MAIYYARANGNVNGVIWATTPTGTASDLFSSFTNADTLMSNNFTVTLNVNTTVLEIRNDTTGGATAGGKFNLSTGVTLTASIVAGGTTCVTAAGTCAIVGNLTATGAGAAVDGSFTALSITGNITSSTTSATGYGVQQFSGTLSVTGNVTANAATAIISNSNATVNVTGSVVGGASSNANGISSFLNATIVGTATGGSAGAGVNHGTAGTCTVTRAKGGASASAAVGVIGSAAGSTSVEEIEYGDLGASPVAGSIRLIDKSSNVAIMYRFGSTKKNLVDPNASGLMPAVSDVRFGVVYNGGNSTGACKIPPPSSVAFGVLVDVSSSGTAALTPASVWDYLISATNTSGSIGARLKNAATIDSVATQVINIKGN